MNEPPIRKVAQGVLPGDQLSPIVASPNAATVANIPLEGFDIPVGFVWDISVIDLLIGANMFAGAVKIGSNPPNVFVRASSVPVASFSLEDAGQGGSSGTEYLFRGTFNMPTEVSLLPGDQLSLDIVSKVTTGAVADGTNIRYTVWAADFLMTIYGIQTRRN